MSKFLKHRNIIVNYLWAAQKNEVNLDELKELLKFIYKKLGDAALDYDICFDLDAVNLFWMSEYDSDIFKLMRDEWGLVFVGKDLAQQCGRYAVDEVLRDIIKEFVNDKTDGVGVLGK